jgi:hypothetical protein
VSCRYSRTLLLAAESRNVSVRAFEKLDQLYAAQTGVDRLIAQSRRCAEESLKLITEADLLLERPLLLQGSDANDAPARYADLGPPAERANKNKE